MIRQPSTHAWGWKGYRFVYKYMSIDLKMCIVSTVTISMYSAHARMHDMIKQYMYNHDMQDFGHLYTSFSMTNVSNWA